MKCNLNKILLEAVNRGIKFALDDFNDDELMGQQTQTIKDINHTKDYLDLMDQVVDMGLPSGTLWCKYNLGSTVDKNYGHFAFDFYGNYYAWGETKEKIMYAWDTLTFYENGWITKYNEYDKLKQLLPEDDVAYKRQECHNFKFHIPTKEQCEELLKYTDNYFIKYTNTTIKNLYGNNNIKTLHGDLYGVLFISKINQNSLFFPAAGYKTASQVEDMKIAGGIWTITNAFGHKDIQNYNKAFFLHFDNEDRPAAYMDIDYRGRGLNIRPVINLNEQ